MAENIMQVFSTPIYYKKHSDMQKLNETLCETVRKLDAENSSVDVNRAHQGGYYSDGTFFDMNLPGVEAIKQVFTKSLDNYFRELGVLNTIKSVHLLGWAALTRTRDYQTPHVHRGATISGVYYVQMPKVDEPSGCLDFITPLDVQEMTFLRGMSKSHCRLAPKAGTLTLFPSYMRHYTHPFESDVERICIVINAFVEQ